MARARQAADHIRGPVGRVVVDDDQLSLHIDKTPFEEVGEPDDVAPFIEGRNADG